MTTSLRPRNVRLQVQDYLIGDKLGSGAFGQIRVAFHQKSGNPYAVKVLSKAKLQGSRHSSSVVFNETLLAPLLAHPSLMEIIDVADSHTQIFQFMRFADQGDLCRVLRKSILPRAVILRLVDQLLAAVEYLHSYGIVHRDIKLDNIMLSRHTGIRLGDFGLASLAFDGRVRGNFGTFEYSAPEAIRSTEFDGFRADMWSVGVVIFALFSRRLPFLNVDRNYRFEEQRVDYSRVPEAVVPLVQQLLSIDPSARPSATEARGFAALCSSQTQRREPLSALTALDADDGRAFAFASKVSQVLRVPVEQLLARFRAPAYTKEKLLLLLHVRRAERIGFGVLSSPERVCAVAHSMPPKLPEKTFLSQVFPVSASALFELLHQRLMREGCCVSSPLFEGGFIEQKKEGLDRSVKIRFNCFDRVGGGAEAVLTLDARDDPVYGLKLAQDILDFLKNAFVK